MKKHILVSNDLSLEIDDSHLYINNEKYEPKDGENFKEVAEKQKKEYYKKKLEKLLLSDNLLLLTGAGTSIGFGGKIMSELWNEAEKLTLREDTFELFCQAISYNTAIKDLEALLSEAEINLKSSKELPDWFEDFKLEIEKMIKKRMFF